MTIVGPTIEFASREQPWRAPLGSTTRCRDSSKGAVSGGLSRSPPTAGFIAEQKTPTCASARRPKGACRQRSASSRWFTNAGVPCVVGTDAWTHRCDRRLRRRVRRGRVRRSFSLAAQNTSRDSSRLTDVVAVCLNVGSGHVHGATRLRCRTRAGRRRPMPRSTVRRSSPSRSSAPRRPLRPPLRRGRG
jgi:hypothetical protein